MSNPVILHGERVCLAVQLTDFFNRRVDWFGQWSQEGLQLFPMLILIQRAQTRVEGRLYFVLCGEQFQRDLRETVIKFLWAQFAPTQAKKSFDSQKNPCGQMLFCRSSCAAGIGY